ncbi:uncharacterized protein SAPINGB_P003777 [Magnusiomyces paraingens]|uniref:Pre-mRNA-splicing factor 38 n=1 Tax=Magnusiomyces paraingens TaxID=2606893 RepID=A0A5E8BRX9_9ASCO|nr:uncharacterized protein SAPINGB_P003777 [Saprochaete ingens]VVT53841.1 unnamed protein product [Saprochaete ingens]
MSAPDAASKPESARYIIDRGVVSGGTSIHNINPGLLVEKILRERIFESLYYKEKCFGLNVATLCDRAVELEYIGGQYANHRVSPFLCLLYKLILLQPKHDIVLLYLTQNDFKYLTAIAAFYVRLFFEPHQVFATLEPLLADKRKLRFRSMAGVSLTYMDEYIDTLLTQDRVCDITLPRLPKRIVLEDAEKLEPRLSAIASDLEDSSSSSDDSDSD